MNEACTIINDQIIRKKLGSWMVLVVGNPMNNISGYNGKIKLTEMSV